MHLEDTVHRVTKPIERVTPHPVPARLPTCAEQCRVFVKAWVAGTIMVAFVSGLEGGVVGGERSIVPQTPHP